MCCMSIFGYSQSRTVTGVVTDDFGQPLDGASYVVKNTSTSGITGADGSFSVMVSGNNAVIEFTYVGFKSTEVTVGENATLTVVMQRSDGQLETVVVTALGIKRESKSLGYTVQEVKGEAVVATRETNIANTLSGKVAGLQVIKSSNGPAGSSKIVLRGFNSLTGDNQPLIVVDGVPISNFTGQRNNDYWYPSADLGNGLTDLNADDIASISVLKGPAAAALYGSRAGNGVILITSKTGKVQKGAGISFSATFGFEKPFMTPERQDAFGTGSDGIYDIKSNLSWGPKIEGQTIKNWDSTSSPMTNYDNLGNFLKTGFSSNYNVAFQQMYHGTSVYASYNHVGNESMIPGATLTRNNLMARTVTKMASDRLTLDAKIQYSNTNAENRPLGGPDINANTFALMYLMPSTIDITKFSDPVKADGKMLWYGTGNGINPYWSALYKLNSDVRNRFIMSGGLKYQFTSWLTGEIRAGGDLYSTTGDNKTYAGSPLTSTGRYGLYKEDFREANYSSLFIARKDNLFGKIGGTLTLGGNIMQQKSSGLSSSAGELEVPNLFSLNNSKSNPTVGQSFSQRQTNSLFGSAQVNYEEMLFLEATLRNDWTSTLAKQNRSFLYPSVSASFVFTELMNNTDILSYGKLRASFASVGNDLSPYQLYNTFWIGKDPNGVTNAGRNTTLYNDNVVNELIKSIEVGTELRFLNNRFGLDFTFYKTNAINQLMAIPLDPLSGYERKIINAGNIQNTGVELVLSGSILRSTSGLNWDMLFNISNNKNKIVELAPDEKVTQYGLGGFDNVQILAVEGENYGDIYGSTYKRVEDKSSPYYNQLILTGDGLPQLGEQKAYLGNQQANVLLGWTNTVSYKNLALSFLIDGRFGGQIFSGTRFAMQFAGTGAETVTNGERAKYVLGGVIEKEDGTYEVNTKEITPQQYWRTVPGNLGFTERNIYDATNVRLRNVQLNYTLPSSLTRKVGIQNAKVGFSVNNVWMLKSYILGVDPESVFATGTNAVGFENLTAPTSRTYFINLAFNF